MYIIKNDKYRKHIFKKYYDKIYRLQYIRFNPALTQNLNKVNKKTEFQLDLEDELLSKNIQYYIAGEFTAVHTTKSYNNIRSITMIGNFVAHLFSHIEVKKHNTLIHEIEYPGIATTIKGRSEYPGLNTYNDKAINSGFKTHIGYEGPEFEAVGNLGSLGLGFFSDITVQIYRGGFKILFTRNSDNNVIYRWKPNEDDKDDAASLPAKGKMTINPFYLRVPVTEYNNISQITLIKE